MDDIKTSLQEISESLGDLSARISAIEKHSIANDLPAAQQETTPAAEVDIAVDVNRPSRLQCLRLDCRLR